jgi:hypothetical protein
VTSLVGTINVGTLAAGTSGSIATTFTAPTAAGTYTVLATAKTTAPESNTANNTATATVAVATAPTPTSPEPIPASCDYYASPAGGGTGLSMSSSFRIIDAWSVLAPGTTLCLLDGVYRSDAHMISPGIVRPRLSGVNGRPITVKALNDGAVLIDGEGVRSPVRLRQNNWMVFEGFNAANSISGVISTYTSSQGVSNVTFRRICAWNAGGSGIGGNSHVIDISYSTDVLVEDSCAFGLGRTPLSRLARTASPSAASRRGTKGTTH